MRLYRGVNETTMTENGIHQNPYINRPRKPRNTDPKIHAIVDDWFYKKFEIRARSQTIFCSPDIGHAKEYISKGGELLEIKLLDDGPVGLIFSPKVYDFIEIMEELPPRFKNRDIINWLEEKKYEMVRKIDSLPEDFKGEVMLFCKTYGVQVIENK